MDYSIFPPLMNVVSSPLLIAVIATLHVAVSHFAIGGGLLLYLDERRAIREADSELLDWLGAVSKKFLYVSVTFGAVSGVAIWFVVGLLSPLSTSYLIQNFVWVWGMEWAFFLLEVFAILVYVGTWGKIPEKLHLRIGLVYFIAAWMSLFLINGILTFQLTPSKIKEPINLFKAFFNRTFFPSLFARTCIAVLMASLFFLFFLAFRKDSPFRAAMARRYFRFALFSSLIMVPFMFLYRYQVHKESLENFTKISYMQGVAFFGLLLLVMALALAFFFTTLFPKLYRPGFALVPLVCAALSFGLYEWIREDLRLPYIVSGMTYGNDLGVKNYKKYQDGGLMASAPFIALAGNALDEEAKGEFLYKKACGSCHSISGVNALGKVFSAVDESYAAALVRKSTFMKAPMPPFPGGDDEARLIASHIRGAAGKGEPPSSGAGVFAARCAPCHNLGKKYRDLRSAFEGFKEDDIYEMIAGIDSMTDSMPPWTGTDAERRLLASHLAKESSKGGPQ